MITHVGLVKMNFDGSRIEKIQYLESRWERELGDVMTVEGEKFRVGVIADSRNEVIDTLNEFIKLQNKIVRKQNKIENAKADAVFNKIMREAMSNALDF